MAIFPLDDKPFRRSFTIQKALGQGRLTFGEEVGLNGRHKRLMVGNRREDCRMKRWKRPVIREIQVGMEINLYVCAEL